MRISELPISIQKQFQELSPEGQADFNRQFQKKQKSTGVAYMCWLLLGIHYAYLGKWGLFLAYWFTAAGLGFWLIADLFRIPSVVREYNENEALNLMLNIKMLEK